MNFLENYGFNTKMIWFGIVHIIILKTFWRKIQSRTRSCPQEPTMTTDKEDITRDIMLSKVGLNSLENYGCSTKILWFGIVHIIILQTLWRKIKSRSCPQEPTMTTNKENIMRDKKIILYLNSTRKYHSDYCVFH